jgi:hypothetical protein
MGSASYEDDGHLMKYREGTIPKTIGQLRDKIGATILRAPMRHFPESYGHDFDGIFCSLACGVENLRARLADAKADYILDMLAQAKAHYEAGENQLGGALMQDTQMAVMDRKPWAYPKERYRWPINPELPELSELDFLNKGDEDD